MSELKVEKHWVEGGQLFIKVSCADREKLTNGVRAFAMAFVEKPDNGLTAWAGAGADKAECPQAYDPKNPELDVVKANEKAAQEKRAVAWQYTQVVRLTRGI